MREKLKYLFMFVILIPLSFCIIMMHSGSKDLSMIPLVLAVMFAAPLICGCLAYCFTKRIIIPSTIFFFWITAVELFIYAHELSDLLMVLLRSAYTSLLMTVPFIIAALLTKGISRVMRKLNSLDRND
jgi:uncharacterized membrane protein AbrB (regulator of aidB expression)